MQAGAWVAVAAVGIVDDVCAMFVQKRVFLFRGFKRKPIDMRSV